MKSMKVLLIGTAILLGIGGAWASTRPCLDCALYQQYYFNGYMYIPVLEYAYDYYCYQYGGTCTYYKPYPNTAPNYYAPCREGLYSPL